MKRRRSFKLLLAAALLIASSSTAVQTALAAGSAEQAAPAGATAEDGTANPANSGNAIEPAATAGTSAAERAMLDPGFGYFSHFTHDLATSLLADSPVTAYLPTRPPDTAWQFYGLKSSLSEKGYSVTAFRTSAAQPVSETLPGADKGAAVDPAAVLYLLKAGSAAEAKLTVPQGAKQLQSAGGWTYWADGFADPAALAKTFAAITKPGAPVTGASGTVLAEGSGSKAVYSASWTVDGSTYYSFVSHGSLADFTSMLTSFRPVSNLLQSADVVLLPKELQLKLQVGRGQLYEPYENKFISLTKAPAVFDGSVYLPLRDIATVIGGEIQFVGKEGAVYVSQNGYFNELKLNLRTGAVNRGTKMLGRVKPVVQDGTTLVPLRFMTEQFGLPVDYDAASKAVTVHASKWAESYNPLQTSGESDLNVKVFTINGPPFLYENEKAGINAYHGYTNLKPPQGYNGLKYATYEVSVPLIPGDNELVLRDMQTSRIIDTIPVGGTVKPENVPFRYSGLTWFDGLDLKLKLASGNGRSWPAGYAETDGAVDLTSGADFKAFAFSSLKVGYQIGTTKSGIVSVPVKDGKFAYRLLLNKGPGTYVVTIYAPNAYPMADLAPIVSFIVVVPKAG